MNDVAPLPDMTDLARVRAELGRFMLNRQFAINEVMTKLTILRTEFEHLHDYSPIDHVGSRLKTPEGIIAKARQRGVALDLTTLGEEIRDIAGIRVVCSFISDAYWVAEMLTKQSDITLVEVKDYIAEPKENGYKSLHLIIKVPVFLSESVEDVIVEVQLRTVAMDFWASLEHKIYYKYDQEVPARLQQELTDAARDANRLDETMERLHNEVRAIPRRTTATDAPASVIRDLLDANRTDRAETREPPAA